MKLFGTLSELVKVVFRSGGRETKLDAAQQTGSQTDVTFRLPDLVNNSGSAVIATIVEKDLAQTLTNKTLTSPTINGGSVTTAARLDGVEVRKVLDASGNPTLKFYKDGGANSISMYAAPGLGGNIDFVLPPTTGTNKYPLLTDGAGATSWAQITDASVSSSAAIADTKLATISTSGKVSNSATTATNSNNPSTIVARDASGNFSAGTITASLSGNVTGNVSGSAASFTGSLAGDVSGTQSATSVDKIKGKAVSASAPTDAQHLIYNNSTSQWVPVSISGDITMTNAGAASIGASKVTNSMLAGSIDLTTKVTGTLPVANGGTGITSLGAGVATFLGTPNSANLATAVTDETGSGSLVFGTSPTLSSPQVNSGITVQQIATPSNPSSGFNKIYTKSDGILYKLDSAGNEVAVGSGAGGSGEVNAILNPSAATDTTGWSRTDTNYTVSKDSANSPLAPAVSTSLAMSTTTASSESSTSGISYAAFSMPTGLRNRKLKIEFFMTTPASTAGTWAMSLYDSGGTRVALSTDSSSVTTLPAGVTGKYVAYFDATSSATYSLRFTQTARSSANTMYVTNVIVGPGIQPQGAVVGEWVSFTPEWSPITGYSSNTGRYRRVGDSMQVMATLIKDASAGTGSGNLLFKIPLSLNVDSTKILGSTDRNNFGVANAVNVGGVANFQAQFAVWYNNTAGSTYVAFQKTGTSTRLVGTDVGASAEININFTVPIAEWAGSGTVQLAQNDVEFASNASSSDAADDGSTGNFRYGPSGSVGILGTTNLSAMRAKRVRFQTPIQAGDRLEIEIKDASGAWFPHHSQPNGSFAWAISGSTEAGMSLDQINSTDVDVRFYPAPSLGTGAVWSNAQPYGWRVRKSSAGAAVGFGLVVPGTSAGLVSASGLPGNTTGNSIASGYVGEKQVTTPTETSLGTTDTDTSIAASSFTLTSGVWLVTYHIAVIVSGTAGSLSTVRVKLRNTSANADVDGSLAMCGSGATDTISSVVATVILNLSGTTNFELRAARGGGSSAKVASTSMTGGMTDPDASSRITAIRIA